jgi:hypothetical protein
MEHYRNEDGTYTSPRNGKTYKSLKAFTSHWNYAGTTDPDVWKSRLYNVACPYCKDEVVVSNIKKHERSCYLNPVNLRSCIVCDAPIKDYKKSKGTCSHACSNKHFRHLRNKPERYTSYRTICWEHHDKICIVCGEDKIVEVHHVNEDHNDNRPENLIPLCPTHHQYVHSRYRDEVQPLIDEYIKNKLSVA